MQAFFFGDSDSPLYGVSHSPTGSHFQNSAILILNPQGHEYIRSHKALRLLADNLSKAGFYVMRFDYQATGDSRGDLQDITLDDWIDNIKLAADELRAISGQNKITAIGLRLGASLALKANEEAGFKNIILWDPVTSGEKYIENLELLHKELLANTNSWFIEPLNESEAAEHELLGYQYSEKLLNSLRQLDLQSLELSNKLRVKHLHTYLDDDLSSLNRKLEDELRRFSHFHIEDMGDWEQIMKIDNALLTHQITNKIIEELA